MLSDLARPVVEKARQAAPLLIFGGGTCAKMLASYLADVEGVSPTALVISDGRRETSEYTTLKGNVIKFMEISEVKREIKSSGGGAVFDTVVTTKDVIKSMMEDLLASIGGGEYFDITGRLYYDICRAYIDRHIKHFKADDRLDLEADQIFKFGSISVANPLPCNPDNEEFLFATLGDEIFPRAYGDTSLAAEGPYEIPPVDLKPGDVVIDAGANIGLFSCCAASIGCDVMAFEPDEDPRKALEKQKEIYPNIKIFPMGLSDEDGEATFYFSSTGSANTSLAIKYGQTLAEKKIAIAKLDTLVENGTIPRVDFIKADVEGAERNLLLGAQEVMRRFAPKLSICTYHLPDDKEVLTSIVKKANPNYIIEHKWRKLYAYVPA